MLVFQTVSPYSRLFYTLLKGVRVLKRLVTKKKAVLTWDEEHQSFYEYARGLASLFCFEEFSMNVASELSPKEVFCNWYNWYNCKVFCNWYNNIFINQQANCLSLSHFFSSFRVYHWIKSYFLFNQLKSLCIVG